MHRPTKVSHTKMTRPEMIGVQDDDLSSHPNRAAIQAVLEEPGVNLADPRKRVYRDDWLASRRPPRSTRREEQQQRRENLAAVFGSRDAITTAVYEGFVTDRQGALLEQVLWNWDEEELWTTNLQRIAERFGCSRWTVWREVKEITNRVCRVRPVADLGADGGYRITRERGVRRQRRAWIVRTNQIGRRLRPRAELVSNSSERRKALGGREPSTDAVLVPIRVSPMMRLLTTLAVLVSDQRKVETVTRGAVSSDRVFNVAWAERRIQTARRKVRPGTIAEAVQVLSRGCPVCLTCGAPILLGARIDGSNVTRARKYCDPACREAHRRRGERHA